MIRKKLLLSLQAFSHCYDVYAMEDSLYSTHSLPALTNARACMHAERSEQFLEATFFISTMIPLMIHRKMREFFLAFLSLFTFAPLSMVLRSPIVTNLHFRPEQSTLILLDDH